MTACIQIAVKLDPILTVSFRLERGGQFESGFQSTVLEK
jgi:hypothetical protein